MVHQPHHFLYHLKNTFKKKEKKRNQLKSINSPVIKSTGVSLWFERPQLTTPLMTWNHAALAYGPFSAKRITWVWDADHVSAARQNQ